MLPQTRTLVVALIDLPGRREAARRLGEYLGAVDLIIFVADSEIGVSLPALGFPQTLPNGRIWRRFIDECVKVGHCEGEVPLVEAERMVPAAGLAAEDGTVLVLLGGEPRFNELEEISLLLPFVGASFRAERLALTAAANLLTARQTTAEGRALAEKLQLTRSELQQALIAAEAAAHAKDEFLAVVSHELRTPLNAILGWARMLRVGKLDPESVIHAVETIERNAKSQTKLIEDLLDFSRIISGKLRLDVGPVELASVVEAAADVVRPAADAKEIRLQIVLDPRAGPVPGDPERLQQMMWNLLSNAVKFTPKGGRVQVRLERINSHVEITVSDTGEGISAEFLPLVFERFVQADNTTTRRHGGLGLGLAITRHLAELHGGTISADSAGEGQGATFTLMLPVMSVHGPAHQPTTSDQQPFMGGPNERHAVLPRLDGLHVLVVDDEHDARRLLNTVLTQSGAKVTAVATVADALEKLQLIKPDLLVSDIEMPNEDGYSLIRKVRLLEKAQGGLTPAIALTAHARFSDRMRALTAGYQMHLPKPVEPMELVTVIANLRVVS
ncbi:MAG: ATP-binding response regulator [Pyrinomonadaceae bacterium]